MPAILREITIGRDKNCDIYLDSRCKYASSHHASIYMDGNQLMYRDESSNGTLINNVSVRHRAVPIRHGDIIMIAGQYPINWNQIDAFFPPTRPIVKPVTVQTTPVPTTIQPDIERWSWGAFTLYPIWGFFNGCWWAVLVWIFLCYSIIPSILFGIFGRRQAWANGSWSSAEEFNRTQEKWDQWGLGLFIFSIVIILIIFLAIAIAFA